MLEVGDLKTQTWPPWEQQQLWATQAPHNRPELPRGAEARP